MAFKIESKELYPIFDFAMCCRSVHSYMARLRTGNREKPPPHKLCSFTSSLCACSASSASI